MENLVFKVTPDLAKAFRKAGSAKKKQAELMINMWLMDLLSDKNPDEKLAEIMNRAGKEAQRNGLNAEILNNLLKD